MPQEAVQSANAFFGPAPASLQLRSWRWWVNLFLLARPFLLLSVWAYTIEPGGIHLSPKAAYGAAVVVGTVIGFVWQLVGGPRSVIDRICACGILTFLIALLCLVPATHASLSLVGAACQVGMLGGLGIGAARQGLSVHQPTAQTPGQVTLGG